MESDVVLSATVGIIYAIVSCIYSVKFVSQVAMSIQAIYLISNLSLSAQKAVESEQIDSDKTLKRREDKAAQVYYRSDSFKDDLYEIFMPIIKYGCQDWSVVQSIFNSFKI